MNKLIYKRESITCQQKRGVILFDYIIKQLIKFNKEYDLI